MMRSKAFLAVLIATTAMVCAVFQSGCDEDGQHDIVQIDVPESAFDFLGITNGQPTNWEIWKGVVAVYNNAGGLCTGTLIDPEVVLTAGHCVYYPSQGINVLNNPGAVQILGGANLYSGAVLLANVSAIVKHPTWTGDISVQSAVDLALIRTATPVNSVPNYGVRSGAYPTVGTPGVVVGYGNSTTGSGSGIHRWGNTTIKQIYQNLLEHGTPAGTCQGDSGGPLFTEVGGQWQVTGVTSFGTSYTCDPNSGNWSVTVQTYRPWIENQVIAWTGHGLGGGSGDADTDSDSDADSDADADADNDIDADSDGDADDTGDDKTKKDNPFGLDNPNPLQSCAAAPAKVGRGLGALLGGLISSTSQCED